MSVTGDNFDADYCKGLVCKSNWFIGAMGIIILVLCLSGVHDILSGRGNKKEQVRPAEKTAVNQKDVEALIRANEELIRINKKLLETIRLSNDKGDE